MYKLKVGLMVESTGKMRGEVSYNGAKYAVKGCDKFVVDYLNNAIKMSKCKTPCIQLWVNSDVHVMDILGREADDDILCTLIAVRKKYKNTGENLVWQFDGENFCEDGDINVNGEDYMYESVIRVCNCLMAHGNISGHEDLWEVYNYIIEHEDVVVDV